MMRVSGRGKDGLAKALATDNDGNINISLDSTHATHTTELNLKSGTTYTENRVWCASGNRIQSQGGIPFDFRNKPKKYLKLTNTSSTLPVDGLAINLYATLGTHAHLTNERSDFIALPQLLPGDTIIITGENEMSKLFLPFAGVSLGFNVKPTFDSADKLEVTLLGGI